MQASNSLRLTHFFDPTYNTKGLLGYLSMASILLMPILLYSDASLMESVSLRWMGTLSGSCMIMPPIAFIVSDFLHARGSINLLDKSCCILILIRKTTMVYTKTARM